MALDLLEQIKDETLGSRCRVGASYLVALLCKEADICWRDKEFDLTEVQEATFEYPRGFEVVDTTGRRYRLQITAEEITR